MKVTIRRYDEGVVAARRVLFTDQHDYPYYTSDTTAIPEHIWIRLLRHAGAEVDVIIGGDKVEKHRE